MASFEEPMKVQFKFVLLEACYTKFNNTFFVTFVSVNMFNP